MTGEISMQALSDDLEIRNLLAHMAQLADEGTPEDCIACMTEDAYWEMRPSPGSDAPPEGFPVRRGHAEILVGIRERRASGTQGPGTHTRHLITTTVVIVRGETAAATSNILFALSTDGEHRIGFAGKYDDEFRRSSQGWKLSRRLVTPS